MADFADEMPHGELTGVFDDVHVVHGSVRMMPLVVIPRTMVVVRAGSELTLINAVRLSEAAMADLEALGAVKHIVRLGSHGMDNAWYLARYPEAQLWAPAGMKHAGGLQTQQVLESTNLPFGPARYFGFEHTVAPEGALLLERHGGVLITCDAVQNWESTHGCSPMGALATRLMGFMKPAQIGPPWRKAMTPKDGTLRPDFERLAALPFQHVIGGHGVPLLDSANERLRETITRTYG